jgi:hypothetical protein
MLERLRVLFRSTLYVFRGGFLIRPLLIVLALGTAGALLSCPVSHPDRLATMDE